MLAIANTNEILRSNPIDSEALRDYVEFLQLLAETGVDVRSAYDIKRPLAEPIGSHWVPELLTNRQVSQTQQ